MVKCALSLAVMAGVLFACHGVASAGIVASYDFNNTLAANEAGVPALVAIDPASANGFVVNPTLGQTVYQFGGTNFPTNNQGGLSLDTTGLLGSGGIYSVEMKFQFFDRDGAWRRILDVQNRQSDNGFYVDPNNTLDIFPQTGTPNAFTNNVFHDVILSVDPTANGGAGGVYAYLDGVTQLNNFQSHLMDFGSADNPGNLLLLFVDNVIAGGQGEWSAGQIASLRLYDTVIVPEAPTATPEPASMALLCMGGGLLAVGRKFRRRKTELAA